MQITTKLLLLAALLPTTAAAFQLADGTPPPPQTAEKYILYWGQQQVDLTEANGYKSQQSIAPEGFRQMLLNPPKLWNGKSLLKSFRFKLDETSLNTDDYIENLAQLDAAISTKIKVGNVLSISMLPLSEGTFGVIDFLIEPRDEEPTLFGNAPRQRRAFLNNYLVDRVVWGREDILETTNRDFFTVREFWQSIRQEPVVLWQFNQKPQALRCVIDFTTKDKTSLGMSANLEDMPYSIFLEGFEPYRHMIHPGSSVSLELQTVGQYELLYEKNMSIVADDDPRLRLRGSRDYHSLEIRWGSWFEKMSDLYLLSMEDGTGKKTSLDPAIAQNSAMTFETDSIGRWIMPKPICSIDAVPVSGNVAFLVSVNDSMSFHVQSATYNADAVTAFLSQFGTGVEQIRIDSIAVEGYELPPMVFVIYNMRRNGSLLVKNDFNSLQILSERPKKTNLSPPEIGEKELVFNFELLKTTRYALSIFEPDGWNSYLTEGAFSEGKIAVKVPRSALRKPGKHFAFLNTVFGVWKVAFEVD